MKISSTLPPGVSLTAGTYNFNGNVKIIGNTLTFSGAGGITDDGGGNLLIKSGSGGGEIEFFNGANRVASLAGAGFITGGSNPTSTSSFALCLNATNSVATASPTTNYGALIQTTGTQTSVADFYGLIVNDTGTFGSGNHRLLDLRLSGSSALYVQSNGNTHSVTGSFFVDTSGGGYSFGAAGGNGSLTSSAGAIQLFSTVTTAGSFGQSHNNSTFSGANVTQGGVQFNFVLNQTGTSSFTDVLINRTNTAAGSGVQRLFDCQVGSTTQFYVTPTGNIVIAGNTNTGNGLSSGPSYSFTGSSTTGLYWGNPGIGFAVAGASVGVWTASALTANSLVSNTGVEAGTTSFSYGAPITNGYIAFGSPAQTYTLTTTTGAANFQANYFGIPTFTNASANTVTNLATVTIAGAPVVAGSQVATNLWSLYIIGGNAFIGANATISGSLNMTGSILCSTGASSIQYPTITTNSNRTVGAWGTNGIAFIGGAQTYTDNSSATGTIASNMVHALAVPTLAASNTGVIYTTSATLYIAGAPTAGTNVTLTNPWALFVAAGNVNIAATTASTNLTTGALVVAGGVGISGNATIGTVNIGSGGLACQGTGLFNLSLIAGANAYSFGALASGATTTGPVYNAPAQTYTVTGTNTATNFQASYFGIPTFTNLSAGTITNAATIWINGAPVAAGSLTITNSYSLYVNQGNVLFNNNLNVNGSVQVGSGIKSASASAGVGYSTGAGGAVTQLTNRTTGVTLSKVTGAITLFAAIGSVTATSFVVTNTAVAATDVIEICQSSGTNLYQVFVTAVSAGSFTVTFYTTGGTASDSPVFQFSVIKSVTS